MEKNKSSIIIANRYQLQILIGSGGFGEVYRAEDLKTKKLIAVKLEKRTNWSPILHYESKILHYLKDVQQTPQAIQWGFQGDYNYLAMQLAGESLDLKLLRCGGRFSVKVAQNLIKRQQ